MTKALITEQSLIDAINDAINSALPPDWPHKDCHCEVSALRKVEYPERNWEVAQTNSGGSGRPHTEVCDRLLDRVPNELVVKYDVRWPT